MKKMTGLKLGTIRLGKGTRLRGCREEGRGGQTKRMLGGRRGRSLSITSQMRKKQHRKYIDEVKKTSERHIDE